MKRYRLYELKLKSAVITEHDDLLSSQKAKKGMKDYVIFDKKEDRIIQVSNRTAKE
jgi:hypothetical protein